MDLSDVSWTHIASAIFGGGGASFIARFVIDRAIKTLDEITQKLENVAQKLVIVETKLEALQVFKDLVVEHDRKIVDLDTRARGRSSARLKD